MQSSVPEDVVSGDAKAFSGGAGGLRTMDAERRLGRSGASVWIGMQL